MRSCGSTRAAESGADSRQVCRRASGIVQGRTVRARHLSRVAASSGGAGGGRGGRSGTVGLAPEAGRGVAGAALGQTVGLTLLSFSREQEHAADREALRVVAAEYGHVGGAIDLFEAMRRASGRAAPQSRSRLSISRYGKLYQEPMKTTLDLNDQLLAEAEALAARQRTSLTRLIEEGLQLRLRANAGSGKRRAVRLPVVLRQAAFSDGGPERQPRIQPPPRPPRPAPAVPRGRARGGPGTGTTSRRECARRWIGRPSAR